MKTDFKTDINNQLLKDAVKSLRLRFPVADIHRATNFDKGNISSFLNNKKPVSDAFLQTFSKAFNIDLGQFGLKLEIYPETKIPSENDDLKDKMISILENALKISQAENERLQKKVEKLKYDLDNRQYFK